jgi:hypothetical protein
MLGSNPTTKYYYPANGSGELGMLFLHRKVETSSAKKTAKMAKKNKKIYGCIMRY